MKRRPVHVQPMNGQFVRCRANSAHIRQTGLDSGPGLQVKIPTTFECVPFPLGNGSGRGRDRAHVR